MVKKNRNDEIFKKPVSEKNRRSKKLITIFTKDNKNEYKNLYIFSLVSVVLIFSFFSLPNMVGFLEDNFVKNKTIIKLNYSLLCLLIYSRFIRLFKVRELSF